MTDSLERAWNLSVLGLAPLMEVETRPPTYEEVLANAIDVGLGWWQREDPEPKKPEPVFLSPSIEWDHHGICTGVCCLPSKPMFPEPFPHFVDYPALVIGDRHHDNDKVDINRAIERIREAAEKYQVKVIFGENSISGKL